MNKKYIILIVICGAIIVLFLFYKNKENTNNSEEFLIDENFDQENIVENIVEEKNIKIHITGEVKNEGIIEIKEGDRIADAIEVAGGITENADISKVNLAYELADGQKLYIPSVYDNNFNEIQDDSGEKVLIESEEKVGKININKATESELQNINGVGPSLAQKIIQYREENGKFKSIEDLKNVSGIGDKKFETIKEYVSVK